MELLAPERVSLLQATLQELLDKVASCDDTPLYDLSFVTSAFEVLKANNNIHPYKKAAALCVLLDMFFGSYTEFVAEEGQAVPGEAVPLVTDPDEDTIYRCSFHLDMDRSIILAHSVESQIHFDIPRAAAEHTRLKEYYDDQDFYFF